MVALGESLVHFLTRFLLNFPSRSHAPVGTLRPKIVTMRNSGFG